MSIFESELKNGRFVVGECTKCQKIAWPPNDFCSRCFGNLSWRNVKEPGILVEYSARNDEIFCIVEFENTIRIMGTISNNMHLKPGQKIKILSCGFEDSPKLRFVAD
jgi:uncharacterized OB-fold protein